MQQDFGSATGKDSFMDKSSMPEIMQVKNFGFRSQARREAVSQSVSSKSSVACGTWRVTPFYLLTDYVLPTDWLAFRSQVKWTHLSKEDTTAKNDMGKAEALWGGDAKLAKKYESRMAGTKAANDFARPAGKRRK